MAKARTLHDRLIEWDTKYRTTSVKNNQWKFHNAARWIANDLKRLDAQFDVHTWTLLERVEHIFGKRIRKRVLFNLFNETK